MYGQKRIKSKIPLVIVNGNKEAHTFIQRTHCGSITGAEIRCSYKICQRQRQDKPRQGKVRQDKTRQGKARQGTTRHDKPREDKPNPRQDPTKNTRQDKTKKDKTRQDHKHTTLSRREDTTA